MKKIVQYALLVFAAFIMQAAAANATGLSGLSGLTGNSASSGSSGSGSCSTNCQQELQNAGQSSQAFQCGLDNAQQGDIVFINEAIEDYLICKAQQSSSGSNQQVMIPPEVVCKVIGVRNGDASGNNYVQLSCPSYGKKLDVAGVNDSEGFGSSMTVYKQCNLPPATACGCNQTGTLTGSTMCTQSSSGQQTTNYCNNSDARQKIGSFACGPNASSLDVWDQFMVWHVNQDTALSSGGANCPDGSTPLYLTPGMCSSGSSGGSSGSNSVDTCQQAILNGCPPPNNYKSDQGTRGFNGGESNNTDHSGVNPPPCQSSGFTGANCDGLLHGQIFNGPDQGTASSGGGMFR